MTVRTSDAIHPSIQPLLVPDLSQKAPPFFCNALPFRTPQKRRICGLVEQALFSFFSFSLSSILPPFHPSFLPSIHPSFLHLTTSEHLPAFQLDVSCRGKPLSSTFHRWLVRVA